MGWVGYVTRMGEMRNAYKILVGKPEGKNPLGILGRRREDNIRMDLREVGWEGVDWMHVAQGRDQWRSVVNTGSIKGRGVSSLTASEEERSVSLLLEHSMAYFRV
jgi:hypothetical protein